MVTSQSGSREIACAVAAEVVRALAICDEHVLVEAVARGLPTAAPGQFLQVLCREPRACTVSEREWPADALPVLADPELRHRQAYLRRPFSIADSWSEPDGTTHVCVISRTVGTGTAWLERVRPGSVLNITGPLGQGFRVPEPATPLVLVGGGVGIPPLLFLTRQLKLGGHRDVTVILGARTQRLLPVTLTARPSDQGAARPCVQYPADAGFDTIVTSDDGSVGLRGVVTDALRAWGQTHAARPATVCACGPAAMLAGVARVTRELGLACQLCIERHMGCGLGTCLSCVVRVREPMLAQGWRWALTCQDGPVFDRDDLLDYVAPSGT